MESFISKSSIVILAREYDPLILTPDYLQENEIFPANAISDLKQQPILTPLVSRIYFKNEIMVSLEAKKFEVSYGIEDQKPTKTYLVEIANNFLEDQKHIHFTAVGNNFHKIIPISDPIGFIRKHLMKTEELDSYFNTSSVYYSNKYSYREDKIVTSIEVEPVINTMGDTEVNSGLILKLNFHRDCSNDYPTYAETVDYVNQFDKDYSMFAKISSWFEKQI